MSNKLVFPVPDEFRRGAFGGRKLVETGKQIYTNRISADPIFVTVPDHNNGGLLGINKRGQVLSVALHPAKVVPYVIALGDYGLALRMAEAIQFGTS